MKRTISIQSQDQQNFVYAMLPEARPLQNKVIPQAKSAFTFVSDPAPEFDYQMQPDQPTENPADPPSIKIHQIGASMSQLFKNPVYQSYHQVEINEINCKFATCNIKILSEQKLRPMQIEVTDEQCLIFQSRFQSGNLAIASRSLQDPSHYFLAMQRDTNSHATCQWYYFYVENRNNLGTFTFHIVNMVKSYSAYQNGMKPCVLSIQSKQPWKRDGFNILYRKNSIFNRSQKNYYTFSFSYNFTNKNDRVYFAYSYPYTFTRLQKFLLQIQSKNRSLMQVKILAKTLKDNPVNMVSITNHHSHTHPEQKKQKKDMIMICARVHPGETNSSFACQGLINFLLSNSEQAINIRTHFIIKIIPILNPDGVIHGNYRTSLSGQDLNRKWKRPDKDLHSQIHTIKKYLNQTNYRKILFIDLHGHSKKKSSFMYGCFKKESPYLCKQLPFILSKNSHHFCYFNCNFSTPLSRQGTSRVNMWKQFGVDYSYTMQMSFCGPVRSRYQFKIKDYTTMGQSLGKVISNYLCGKKYSSKISAQISQALKQFYSSPELLNQGMQQSSGSESGQEQLITQDKKGQKISSAKENEKQLKGILTKYLNQSKMKWTRQNVARIGLSQKKQQRVQISLRNHRRQLAPSRVSIQKIDLIQQVNPPFINFAFVKGNIKFTSKELRPSKELSRTTANKNSYCPYSFSKSKLSSKSNIEQNLMLPKVLREQQLKYRKYRKNQCRFQISLSHQQPQYKHESKTVNQGKQISLTQKIFQKTHKQLQDAGRYWVRHN